MSDIAERRSEPYPSTGLVLPGNRRATELSKHSGPELLSALEIAAKPCYLIPRKYLWGTQPKNEYREKDEISVKQAVEKFGESFLREHPPVVVGIATPIGFGLFILDGHHRIRFSGRRTISAKAPDGSFVTKIVPGVDPIPCAVITPQEGYVAENRRRKTKKAHLLSSEDAFAGWIFNSVCSTADSFTSYKPLPDDPTKEVFTLHYNAEYIPNAQYLSDLPRFFQSFRPSIHPIPELPSGLLPT